MSPILGSTPWFLPRSEESRWLDSSRVTDKRGQVHFAVLHFTVLHFAVLHFAVLHFMPFPIGKYVDITSGFALAHDLHLSFWGPLAGGKIGVLKFASQHVIPGDQKKILVESQDAQDVDVRTNAHARISLFYLHIGRSAHSGSFRDLLTTEPPSQSGESDILTKFGDDQLGFR